MAELQLVALAVVMLWWHELHGVISAFRATRAGLRGEIEVIVVE